MKNIIYILLGYIVFATLGLLTSCSKDDAAEKMPVIPKGDFSRNIRN